LHARFAGGEQAIGVHANSVPRSTGVGGDDVQHGATKHRGLLFREPARDARSLQEVMNGDREPKARVNAVVFRLATGIRESVGNHPLRHCP
jgi:hypothetical protein